MNALAGTLLALVVGGVGLTIGFEQYQKSERSTNMQQVITEVSSIIGDAKAAFGQYGYNGVTTAVAVGGGVIPAVRANAARDAATNRFDGAITLAANANLAGTAVLSYAGVPQDLCVQIATATESLARGMSVGTAAVKATDSAINLGTLNTECNKGTTATISWVIGRV